MLKHFITQEKGDFYVDKGVVILISIVLGMLLLGGMYSLFGDTIMPMVTSKIQQMFNYAP